MEHPKKQAAKKYLIGTLIVGGAIGYFIIKGLIWVVTAAFAVNCY